MLLGSVQTDASKMVGRSKEVQGDPLVIRQTNRGYFITYLLLAIQ